MFQVSVVSTPHYPLSEDVCSYCSISYICTLHGGMNFVTSNLLAECYFIHTMSGSSLKFFPNEYSSKCTAEEITLLA